MILGMSLSLYTQIHVIISLIAIASGLLVAIGMMMARSSGPMTALFLATTVLTSVTGFFFPFHGVTPGIVVGILSLVVLLLTLIARYGKHMVGGWRGTYVITAMFALYLNVFVLVVQLFEKVPALKALAPTQTEMPFKVAQLTVLTLFLLLTVFSAIKFRVEPVQAA